jgi:hypothetical protein
MPPIMHYGLSARNPYRPTLGDMRRKGPAWAADYLARRHGIRHRHAVLVVGMLGVDREAGR